MSTRANATCCDALIVGGGPAGLAAAIALRLRDLEVVVVDALSPPIDKACGEGLMPDLQNSLARLGVAVSPEVGSLFEGIAFYSGRQQVAASFAHGFGIGVRRLRLHSLLVDRCRELGVRLAWGSRVTLVRGQPILLNGSRCQYSYLVGADGHSSRVRQWSGLDTGAVSRVRFGIRRHFRVAPWSRMVEVYWCDLGQAYVTPIATNEVCVACLTRSRSGMDAVLAQLPLLQRHLQGVGGVGSVRGGATGTRKLRRVTAGNVALIGDASGSVDAVTGEGLVLSFRQALLLAEAIVLGDLNLYAAGHSALLRLPRIMSEVMLSMDRWPWFRNRAMGVLAHDPRLFGRMLAAHLGEESLRSFLLHNGAKLTWNLLIPPAAAPFPVRSGF